MLGCNMIYDEACFDVWLGFMIWWMLDDSMLDV